MLQSTIKNTEIKQRIQRNETEGIVSLRLLSSFIYCLTLKEDRLTQSLLWN